MKYGKKMYCNRDFTAWTNGSCLQSIDWESGRRAVGNTNEEGTARSHNWRASPFYLPEVVPRRDRLFCKLVIQTAKRIVGITFRRGFIKITVPFNLNSYHTTLNERERQCEFKLSSISLFQLCPILEWDFPRDKNRCISGQMLLDGLSSCL